MTFKFELLTVLKRFSYVLIALMFLPSLSSSANGEKCYTLVPRANRQFAMCLELEKNLNEFCDERPMVCVLKVSPKYPKLTLPKWAALEVEQNMDLIERLAKGRWLKADKRSPGASSRNWTRIRDRIAKYPRQASLSRARIDLANGGAAEMIYRVDTGLCPNLNFGDAANDPEWKETIEKLKVDDRYRYIKTDPEFFSERHAQILDNPEWRALAENNDEPFEGTSELQDVADIFYYEGRAFKFGWYTGPWIKEVSTFRDKWPETPDSITQVTVCQFKYSDSE